MHILINPFSSDVIAKAVSFLHPLKVMTRLRVPSVVG
jgi:hypothetical protein